MRRDALYLRDFAEATDEIASFISDTDETSFLTDSLTQSAIAYQLSIIGEAVGNLPDELKQRYPDVEWGAARSLRNLITHQYFAIDWPIIWDTAKNDIPVFGKQVQAILVQEFRDRRDS